MAEVKKVSLLDIADGAVQERLAVELTKVIANILDPNTPAKEARSITLKATFKPNEDRDNLTTSISCSSKLADNKPIETTIYVDEHDGKPVAVEYTRQVPGQMDTEGNEQSENKLIRLA